MKLEWSTADADELVMSGTDDHGRKYCIHLDRLAVANLCIELEGWLAGRWGEPADISAWMLDEQRYYADKKK